MSSFISSEISRLLLRRATPVLPSLAAVFLVAQPFCVHAQETRSGDSASKDGLLGEVFVTATRRATDLQDVPFSISALAGEDMAVSKVDSLEDVAVNVPGLVMLNNATNENYIGLRGALVWDDSPGGEQGTSTYIDDVVRTGPTDMYFDLFDTDRVEVLKGPQGTLFGRNSLGGVVSIHTKEPVFDSEYGVEASYGNHQFMEFKGLLNVPIVDGVLAGRLVASHRTRDGWVRGTTVNRDLQDQDQQAVRGKLLFTPNDDVRAVFTADFFQAKGTRANVLIGNFSPVLTPGLEFARAGRVVSGQGFVGHDDVQNFGLTAKVIWTTSFGTVTSVTGYREVKSDQSDTATADPAISIWQTKSGDSDQLTQELRFATDSDGKFNWMTGVYYLDSWRSRPINFNFNMLPGGFFESVGLGGFRTNIVRQETDTESFGVFAEGSYELTDTIKATIGLRYTRDEKQGFGLIDPSRTLQGELISADYKGSWDAVTPKFTLSYQPWDSMLAYVTVSKGFMGGGYNTQGSSAQSLETPFDPQYVWNYETGIKYTSANRRFKSNISAFYNEHTDMQLTTVIPNAAISVTTNAGEAEAKGVEAEISAVAADWLTLGVQYAWMDSEFTKYEILDDPDLPPADYSGNVLPFMPEHSVTASADLNFRAGNLPGSIGFGVDYTYRTEMTTNPIGGLADFADDMTVWDGMINAHASWTSEDERVSVTLWGKNLKDILYSSFTSEIGAFHSTAAERTPNNKIYLFRPNTSRMFGATIRYNF